MNIKENKQPKPKKKRTKTKLLCLATLAGAGYLAYCLSFSGAHWAYSYKGRSRLLPGIAWSLRMAAEAHADECTGWYNAPFVLKRTWHRKQEWCQIVSPSLIPDANYDRDASILKMFREQKYLNDTGSHLCYDWLGRFTTCKLEYVRIK